MKLDWCFPIKCLHTTLIYEDVLRTECPTKRKWKYVTNKNVYVYACASAGAGVWASDEAYLCVWYDIRPWHINTSMHIRLSAPDCAFSISVEYSVGVRPHSYTSVHTHTYSSNQIFVRACVWYRIKWLQQQDASKIWAHSQPTHTTFTMCTHIEKHRGELFEWMISHVCEGLCLSKIAPKKEYRT